MAGNQYGRALEAQIARDVLDDADITQRRWYREGTPLWMRVKSLLQGHSRG